MPLCNMNVRLLHKFLSIERKHMYLVVQMKLPLKGLDTGFGVEKEDLPTASRFYENYTEGVIKKTVVVL